MTQPTDFHFYASTPFTWATTTDERDLPALMKIMDLDKLPYTLWYLPVPSTTDYKIKWYAPQVEGALYLGTMGGKKKRATKKGETK